MVFDENKYIYNFTASQPFNIEFTSKLYKILGMKNILYMSNNNNIFWSIINFNIPLFVNIDIVNIETTYITSSN